MLGAVAWVLLGTSALPAQVQYESTKLTAGGALRDGYFGASVAIDGDVVVVGAVGKERGIERAKRLVARN